VTIVTKIIDQAIGVLLFAYLILSIIIPSSGYLILGVLILSLIGLMIRRYSLPLDKDEKIIFFSFIAYFLSALLNSYLFNIDIRELDSVSRFILVLPIFLYIRKSSLQTEFIAYGFAVGAIIFGVGLISYKLMNINLFEFSKHKGMITFYAGIFSISSLFFLNKKRNYLSLIIFITAGFLGISAMLLAGGRGVWIAAIFSIFILIVLNPNYWNKLERSFVLFIFVFLFIISFAIPNSGTFNRLEKAYTGITEFISKGDEARDYAKGFSVMSRLEMWKAGVLILKDNLIAGVGLNNFKANTKKLIQEKKISPEIGSFSHPHGQFITTLVEQGILGLIVLFFVIYLPFRVGLKVKNIRSKDSMPYIIILTTTLFYFFYSFTNGIYAHQNTTLFYALIISVASALLKRDSRQNYPSE